MKVTLMGPDDLDCWFLTDDDGISFPLVARHEDHPAAAALFGWMAPEEITDQEDVIESARLWLMDHISDEIETPKDVAEYFQKLNEETEE